MATFPQTQQMHICFFLYLNNIQYTYDNIIYKLHIFLHNFFFLIV